MTASLYFIVNPAAGGGQGLATWREVRDRAHRLGLDYEFEMTRAPLTATSFVRQALRAGARTIAVVGGDGTMSEAINGLLLDDVPIVEDAAVCLIAAGRSSDIARNLGLPRGASALSLLDEGQRRRVDLARASYVDSRGLPVHTLFCNAARIGGEPYPELPPARFGSIGWTGRFRADGGSEKWVHARNVFIALGPYSGGRRVAPQAKVDDGILDLVIESPSSGVPADLQTAAVVEGRSDARGARIHLEMDDEPPIELDGECVGAGGVDVEILPEALSVYLTVP